MVVSVDKSEIERGRGRRRWLVRILIGGLLFELCVLAGVLASPWFEGLGPRLPMRAEDPAALLVQWRQSRYRRQEDPRIGEKAPRLALRTPSGGRVELTDFRGKKLVLVFARDDSG